MNTPDYSQPPNDVPVYVKYLLGLSQDCSREELANEWTNQIGRLMGAGPQHLFDRESLQLMAGGLTGEQARRVFKQTKRGQMLADSAEREGKARARQKRSALPFMNSNSRMIPGYNIERSSPRK